MVIGGGALIATGIGGPVGGMLIAAGADVIIQKATTGSMDWTETAITAATGGLGRLVAGARLLTAAGNPIRETAVNAAEKAAKYAASPGPHTIDRLLTSTQRFITEGAGALNRGADTILKTIRSPLAEQITKVAHNALDQIEPRPSYSNTTITAERLQHIYHGNLRNDGKWSGGHLWPGKPGKTPFPSNWSEEKIKKNILDLANDPTLEWKPKNENDVGNFTKDGLPNRFIIEAEREGVPIRVVIETMGDGIITAHPIY
ncbi:EndoU domain-containing protein [Rathayibacter toxicus]|nr:EndoU domain-containing protein [Rathayibacter toxicus]